MYSIFVSVMLQCVNKLAVIIQKVKPLQNSQVRKIEMTVYSSCKILV